MDTSYYALIKSKYEVSRENPVELFQTLLAVGEEIGRDEALALLEQCVIEKRLRWMDRYEHSLERTGDPLLDGFNAFYGRYLGVSVPRDGEIIASSAERLVMRWWNPCPTLDACQALGLDTCEICKKVYHAPVQALLSRIDPRLRFERNYAALRPHTDYCEEMILLDAPESG